MCSSMLCTRFIQAVQGEAQGLVGSQPLSYLGPPEHHLVHPVQSRKLRKVELCDLSGPGMDSCQRAGPQLR